MENQALEVPYHMVHGYEDHATVVISPSNLPWSLLPAASLHQDQELIMCPNSLPPFAPSLYGAGAVCSNPSPAGLTEYSAGGSAFMRLNGFRRGTTDQGSASSSLFGTIRAELGKLTAQEITGAKALAATKNHSEAERRRRERINGHLAKLRSMLPNNTKTDKASLLAEVIQHVKELKRQTSEIAEESPLPTEADEIAVESACDEEGRSPVVRASLCCDDRPDLIPDLIGALKALRLRVLKAEITTVGGRVKNALLISHADEQDNGSDDIDATDHDGEHKQQLIAAVQDALKAVLEQAAKHDHSSGGTKRQRTAGLSAAGMIEHSSNV
ncbi:transcription factor AIG1-like [Zingiber officinale]|uniref:BHLH domain-containing protein n=1 Tax=Zingiber officinale TaxID=94328 RepID=A0A8J5C3I8_ZINOF|nr:transcription factor AIG1-like [Zingiber officinale]KAG6471570.1 hypothetical protein ZIOFF_069014 [Zingiber officinale]